MILKKKGNVIIAYAEFEIDTIGTLAKVGNEMGRISLKTGKFTGITKSLIPLTDYRTFILTNKPKTKLTLTIELEFGINKKGVPEEDADVIALNVQKAIRNHIDHVGIVPDDADYLTTSVKIIGGKLE